jgi:hypothetical protein
VVVVVVAVVVAIVVKVVASAAEIALAIIFAISIAITRARIFVFYFLPSLKNISSARKRTWDAFITFVYFTPKATVAPPLFTNLMFLIINLI